MANMASIFNFDSIPRPQTLYWLCLILLSVLCQWLDCIRKVSKLTLMFKITDECPRYDDEYCNKEEIILNWI